MFSASSLGFRVPCLLSLYSKAKPQVQQCSLRGGNGCSGCCRLGDYEVAHTLLQRGKERTGCIALLASSANPQLPLSPCCWEARQGDGVQTCTDARAPHSLLAPFSLLTTQTFQWWGWGGSYLNFLPETHLCGQDSIFFFPKATIYLSIWSN